MVGIVTVNVPHVPKHKCNISRSYGQSDMRSEHPAPSPDNPLGLFASPHPHIKRALAAVGDVRVLEADDEVAEFRQGQPLRHLAAQHADLAAAAFAGNHQYQPRIACIGGAQKTLQRAMRFALRIAVQIKASVDRLLAAGDALLHAAAKFR